MKFFFLSEMHKYRKEYHINPILSVVSMLPKDELAAMAESFVNLTSFKKKVSIKIIWFGWRAEKYANMINNPPI